MDKMKEKGVALLTTAVDEGCSVILIYADEENGVVVVHGNSVDLCATMHTCMEAYKTGKGTTSQLAFADMIMDVIAVNFTPDQMVAEMNKHINNLI